LITTSIHLFITIQTNYTEGDIIMVAPLVSAATSLVGGGGSGAGTITETVNLIGGVVTGLTDFITTAIPTKLDKMRKQRIQELQSQFEAGTLGLTPSQLQEIETLGGGGIQATQKEFFQRQADITRSLQSSPAQLALASQAQAEGLRRQESELQRAIFAAERQAEQAQLGELAGLKAEQRARNKEIANAASSFLTLGLATGGKAASQAEQRQQTFGTSVQPLGGITTIAQTTLTPEQLSKLSPEAIEELRAMGAL